MKRLTPWLLSLAVLPSVVRAEPSPENRRGVFPFLGVLGGYQKLSTDVSSEVSKSGTHWGPRLVGSYYRENWVWDLGLGYGFSRLSGSNAAGDIRMDTDSLMAELTPRYRVSDLAQLGPTLALWMGTDESYAETVLKKSSTVALMGLHLLVDIPSESGLLYRVGGLMLRSFTLDKRATYAFMVDLQIGFDLFGNFRPKAKPPAPPPPPPAPVPEIAKVTDIESVLVTFPEDRLLFAYKMSHLEPARREYLARFGQFLAAHPEAWESMIISGHTDSRGSEKTNDQLSEARAHTVFNILAQEGNDRERMSFKGLGFRKPLNPANSEEAWRLNRRVELEFHGVKDPNLFSREINRIDRERPL